MTKANRARLIKIYNALGGLVSEQEDPFDGIYEGGADRLMRDMVAVLKGEGVIFDNPRYSIAEYHSKTTNRNEWGICADPTDPDGSWCLTGFRSSDEAMRILGDKQIFGDYDGVPPRIIKLTDRAA
mgnify:CR=1 FL=1